MDPRRWETIRAAFEKLVELDAAERASRLAALGSTDPELRAAVESLLAADARAERRLAPLEAVLLGAPSAAPDPLGLAGITVSHFRVLEPLGAGGMGVVYRAEDTRLGRPVALKFLLPTYSLDASAKARFLHEARSAGALDHPNLCSIHEVGESDDGRLFLAMALYPGETLKTRLARDGPLPVEQALEIARQIAQGLGCAHAAGIVHRDLKPGNVMLLPDGTVKILDFGLAKAWDESLSASGARLGTASYMAPEQIRGEAVDGRTDLWALGVVLYEMLTGRKPFGGEGEVAIAHAILQNEPVRPSTLRADVPAVVENLVVRLMEKAPAKRHAHAAEVLTDHAAAVAIDQSASRRGRRQRRVGPVAALAIGGLVVLVAIGTWLRWPSRPASARGERPRIAVLPVANLAGNAEQDPIADGMTDLLINYLSQISGFDRVISRTSVMPYKQIRKPLRQIGRELDVDLLVEASVLRDGDQVRINVSLIDAATEQRRWSGSFDRPLRNVLALQRDVAQEIAREVAVALTPGEVLRLREAASEVNPKAFDLYMQGTKARYDATFTGDFRNATRYLEQAIAEDSGYAPAYAGLAFIHALLADEAGARWYADKAVRLDPQLTDAHLVVGLIRQFFDWDWAGAESAFREAIRLNPGHAEAHHELSMFLMRRRRFDEALYEAQRALYLGPMSARFEHGVGEVYVYGGHYEEALGVARKLLAIDSSFSGAYSMRGIAYVELHKYKEAADAWRQCLRVSPAGCDYARAQLAYIDAVTGRRPEARKVVDALEAQWKQEQGQARAFSTAMNLATVYAGLGEKEKALDWLERGAETHVYMAYVGIEPTFRSLRSEPRFKALLKKMGLDR